MIFLIVRQERTFFFKILLLVVVLFFFSFLVERHITRPLFVDIQPFISSILASRLFLSIQSPSLAQRNRPPTTSTTILENLQNKTFAHCYVALTCNFMLDDSLASVSLFPLAFTRLRPHTLTPSLDIYLDCSVGVSI